MCIGEVRRGTPHFGAPSTPSIEGSGIAASRACRGFEGCQAGCQRGDQFLLLLDRSDQVWSLPEKEVDVGLRPQVKECIL